MSDQILANNRYYDRESYILIVDDDNTLLKFFKIHLNKFFSKVIVAKSAKEATDVLKEKEIDLVITDIKMPRVDGFQLLKRVRRLDPLIPVLIISGAPLSEEHLQTIQDDSDGFLRKPFAVDELHDYINSGMDLREKYKQLNEIVEDKKVLRNILQGKQQAEKVVKDPAKLKEFQETLASSQQMLSKAG